MQDAGGLAGGVALDAAVGRVGVSRVMPALARAAVLTQAAWWSRWIR
ncbi:hypothetical protein ACFQ0B_34990 [Nonomuraea thailandensis]